MDLNLLFNLDFKFFAKKVLPTAVGPSIPIITGPVSLFIETISLQIFLSSVTRAALSVLGRVEASIKED